MSDDELDAIRYRTKRGMDWRSYRLKYDPVADIELSWKRSYDASIDLIIEEIQTWK